MAQVQEYYAPSYPYPSPPQPRLQFENVLDTSETSCGYEDSTQEVTVAQPLLVGMRIEDQVTRTDADAATPIDARRSDAVTAVADVSTVQPVVNIEQQHAFTQPDVGPGPIF
jgi:hypothetical protein